MSKCERYEDLRDYAFEELDPTARQAMEQHIPTCAECAIELQRLHVTSAALRIVPDREIPQRIAFVSDKIFTPSPILRFFGDFWSSAAKLGFVSACLLTAAMTYSAMHRPAEIRTVVQASAGLTQAEVSKQVNEAVQRAVAQVRTEERQAAQNQLVAIEKKYDERQKALMISVQENFEIMQKRLSSYTMLASADMSREGGQ